MCCRLRYDHARARSCVCGSHRTAAASAAQLPTSKAFHLASPESSQSSVRRVPPKRAYTCSHVCSRPVSRCFVDLRRRESESPVVRGGRVSCAVSVRRRRKVRSAQRRRDPLSDRVRPSAHDERQQRAKPTTDPPTGHRLSCERVNTHV